ncbi:probable mitochondrial import inner membrane translocase subunit TIM21 [Amaranthus tricolor]|uniref:probable mitochondrial import inner membrane translocase subunit TIM21 n=1 Tax=Amaranthus tricolor TaxID=29722 RepID=UPI00258B210C|nr:probable mitochondrial import inner membrane translocase subunit TIM21 [Amaranthus tricolor]
MASRVTKSISSARRSNSFCSLPSLKRIFSATPSSSTSRSTPFSSFPQATQTRGYFGFGAAIGNEIGKETAMVMKGQAYSLVLLNSGLIYQLSENRRLLQATQSFYRSYASATASKPPKQKQTEGKKELSTVEDPFDSPTYHIPEKPVTFTEGASYTAVILVGLGVAAAAGYAVFKELIFEPKEYKVFSKALEKVQNDSQVKVRIGSPVKGYGQETRNRAARQRIPHRIWTDEEGVEHVEVNFHIRGPNGDGVVYCEMFKDKEDKQWKYQFLIVDIRHPSPKKLFLESYLPSTA